MSQGGSEGQRGQRGNVTFQAGPGRGRRGAPNDSAGRRGYPADNAKVANTETPTLARCGARRAANVITTCGRMPGSTRRPHEAAIFSRHDAIDGKVEDVEAPQSAAGSPFGIRLVQRII